MVVEGADAKWSGDPVYTRHFVELHNLTLAGVQMLESPPNLVFAVFAQIMGEAWTNCDPVLVERDLATFCNGVRAVVARKQAETAVKS